MMDQNTRPARKVGIADHLWETYEDMAQQMGSDRDALINQALFMFARLNGFIEVERAGHAVGPVASASAPASAPAKAAGGKAPPVLAPVGRGAAPRDDTPQPPRPPRVVEEKPAANALDNDPARREVAERVLETAAELERLIKGNKAEPREEVSDDELEDEPDDSHLDDLADDEPADDPMDEPAEHSEGGMLMLLMDGADPQAVEKDRFVIGRGKHCDLVINSGKVSREHAVIVRDNGEFFIEDLGSSNGTWFNKQRIKRRKVEEGDEYFICSERVRFSYQ